MSFRLRFSQMILCAALLVCSGCGGSGNLGQVEGVLTIDDKPIGQATIAFYPTTGRSSIGFTDDNGHYTLQYTNTETGAVIGDHKVTISTETEGPDQYSEPGSVAPARKESMPRKYLSNKTTDLTATVERGENTIDFKLNSADL